MARDEVELLTVTTFFAYSITVRENCFFFSDLCSSKFNTNNKIRSHTHKTKICELHWNKKPYFLHIELHLGDNCTRISNRGAIHTLSCFQRLKHKHKQGERIIDGELHTSATAHSGETGTPMARARTGCTLQFYVWVDAHDEKHTREVRSHPHVEMHPKNSTNIILTVLKPDLLSAHHVIFSPAWWWPSSFLCSCG